MKILLHKYIFLNFNSRQIRSAGLKFYRRLFSWKNPEKFDENSGSIFFESQIERREREERERDRCRDWVSEIQVSERDRMVRLTDSVQAFCDSGLALICDEKKSWKGVRDNGPVVSEGSKMCENGEGVSASECVRVSACVSARNKFQHSWIRFCNQRVMK